VKSVLIMARAVLARDAAADRVVPPAGFTVRLTLLAAAAMAFLAVFALALSLAAGRIASRWGDELARSSTIRISAPAEEVAAQTAAAIRVLETTPGILSARALSDAEQQTLLEPWFGPDIPIADLPVPQLIEVVETETGYDGVGLRLRLSAEVPGAVLDDHSRWRRPLVTSAARLRLLGWVSILLIGAATAAMVTLAAHAALAANAKVITVLRLVGATDNYIAGAFVRRFMVRALTRAAVGAALAVVAVLLLPGDSDGVLTGVGFSGFGWVWPVLVPLLIAVVALGATQAAARRVLEGLS